MTECRQRCHFRADRCLWLLGLLAATMLASRVAAQYGAPLPVGPPAVAVPAPAAPASFLSSLHGALVAKKLKFCQSPLGKLVSNAGKPLSAMTGGIVPSCCEAAANAAQAAQPGTKGAAAKIKQEEADAKARREAVKYLGTVDCHYYPEAEIGLIAALRTDRSECVRYEAALALSKGCCCSRNTIAALTITVSGSEKDGNPCETSLRVRATAYTALQNCLSSSSLPPPPRPELPVRPEQPQVPTGAETPDSGIRLSAFYERAQTKPWFQLQAEARSALQTARPVAVVREPANRGGRNLLDLWQRSEQLHDLPVRDVQAGENIGPRPIPLPTAPSLPTLAPNTASRASTAVPVPPTSSTFQQTPIPPPPAVTSIVAGRQPPPPSAERLPPVAPRQPLRVSGLPLPPTHQRR